jgi:hypothetical protein
LDRGLRNSPLGRAKCFGMMVARDGVEPPTPAFFQSYIML